MAKPPIYNWHSCWANLNNQSPPMPNFANCARSSRAISVLNYSGKETLEAEGKLWLKREELKHLRKEGLRFVNTRKMKM